VTCYIAIGCRSLKSQALIERFTRRLSIALSPFFSSKPYIHPLNRSVLPRIITTSDNAATNDIKEMDRIHNTLEHAEFAGLVPRDSMTAKLVKWEVELGDVQVRQLDRG